MNPERSRIRLMQGNEACVEGAIAAGCRFYAGYPITPSTEIAELMSERLPRIGGRFIQMEDEIGSMAAVIGASLGGRKAMTATSGPGFSLKQENIGFAAVTEVPCVIVDVQRFGPSTGQPTSPGQGDVMAARWGTHGDHPAVVLSPWSVRETFDLTVRAFNLAEKLRTPVILLSDEVIAHMREKVELPDPASIEVVDRRRPTVDADEYLAYGPAPGDEGQEGYIPPMADFGDGYRYHVTALFHGLDGFPTGDHAESDFLLRRINAKIETRRSEIIQVARESLSDAEVVVVAYGCTARPAVSAVREARARGIKAGLLRLVTIWPFADEVIQETANTGRVFIVPEMNLGQVSREVERALHGAARVVPFARVDTELFTPDEILARISEEA
ncbi:MAG TPA: 2-oxoacid:acceptor oxidoreductase subunit alpha [Bacillota bacterium]|jgi:2-oxoglutarate ferredoxin oxidoreductase subunit alpha